MNNHAAQSNTKQGLISFQAGEGLAGKNGYIARMTTGDNDKPAIKLVSHHTHRPAYVIVDGGDNGSTVSVLPLSPDRQARAVWGSNTTAPAGTHVGVNNSGMLIVAEPTSAGRFAVGFLEENAHTTGQLVAFRPLHHFLKS